MTGTNPGQTRVNSNLNNKSARLWDSGKRKKYKKKISATLNLLLCPKDGIQNETSKDANKKNNGRKGARIHRRLAAKGKG